jgi:two-component sensor histidine kinase
VNGRDELALSWSESGGPTVTAPAERGFGTALIEKGTALQFGGRARIDYEAAGLTCEIVLPSSVLDESGDKTVPPPEPAVA